MDKSSNQLPKAENVFTNSIQHWIDATIVQGRERTTSEGDVSTSAADIGLSAEGLTTALFRYKELKEKINASNKKGSKIRITPEESVIYRGLEGGLMGFIGEMVMVDNLNRVTGFANYYNAYIVAGLVDTGFKADICIVETEPLPDAEAKEILALSLKASSSAAAGARSETRLTITAPLMPSEEKSADPYPLRVLTIDVRELGGNHILSQLISYTTDPRKKGKEIPELGQMLDSFWSKAQKNPGKFGKTWIELFKLGEKLEEMLDEPNIPEGERIKDFPSVVEYIKLMKVQITNFLRPSIKARLANRRAYGEEMKRRSQENKG
jgi:hypothetical protein